MVQYLDPQIPRPDPGVLHQESLDISRVASLERAQNRPLVQLDRVPVAHADAELAYHAREELIVREDDSVDEDHVAQLDNEELVPRGAFHQHVRVLALAQDGRGVLGPRAGLQGGGPGVERRVREPLLARLPGVLTAVDGQVLVVRGRQVRLLFFVLILGGRPRAGGDLGYLVRVGVEVERDLAILAPERVEVSRRLAILPFPGLRV